MASRSNLYKNPSFSYRKSYSIASVLQNLHAYNALTNHPSSSSSPASTNEAGAVAEEEEEERRSVDGIDSHRGQKRRRKKTKEREREREGGAVCDEEGAVSVSLSHQEYIARIRKEMDSARSTYEQLSEDVLQASSSSVQLVQYDSKHFFSWFFTILIVHGFNVT
ncbi:hypothetical protein AKJ16_DCAP24595 [Drosera capensis]